MSPDELQALDVDALLNLRQQIDTLLSEKRGQLAAMLAKIDGDLHLAAAPKLPRAPASAPKKKGNGFSAQFQSKRDPGLTWAGRGLTPRWMREEMKGTKLSKEDFRITA